MQQYLATTDSSIYGTSSRSLFSRAIFAPDESDNSADYGDNQNDDNPSRHSVKVLSADNPRRVRVESDTVFVAEFAPAGAVEVVEGEKRVRVYAEWQHDNAAIVVEGALGRPVNVVDRLGRGVLTMTYAPEMLKIPVSGNGIYIVRVGNSVPVVVIPSAGCR